MHILHLIKTSEGAHWALNLITELKLKYPMITFSVAIPAGGKHLKKYYDVCRDVYLFDYKLSLSILKNGLAFRDIVLKDKPDIIHGWFAQTTLYARLFLRNTGIPRIFQVVGPLHLEFRTLKFFDIKSAQKNDFWIATSKYIYNKYQDSGINKSKIFLNYSYIDVEEMLLQKKSEILDIRKLYNIPFNYKVIGTASYIYPPKFYESTGIKGHEQLLEVFKEVLKIREEVVLIIAGSSVGNNLKYEKKLKKIADSIDKKRIFFTGNYKNVYSIIANFDVFVYLSKSENLGGVFESLLFEIPTVSSNRGALPELVIEGVTGNCVELNNNINIRDKIIDKIEHKSEHIIESGKKKVLELFNKEKIIQNTYNIYTKLLS